MTSYLDAQCDSFNQAAAIAPPYLGGLQILVNPYLSINKKWFCSNEWDEMELKQGSKRGLVWNLCFNREFHSPVYVLGR